MKYCSARPKFGNNHWLWNLFWNPCNAVWFMFPLVLWCNVVIILYNIGQEIMMGQVESWLGKVLQKYLGIYMRI